MATLDGVLDETRAFNAGLERLQASLPDVTTVPVALTRRARREGGGIFPAPVLLPQAREVAIPARGGEVRLRVLAPEREPTGVYLYLHGGGWTLGSADQQDPQLWEIVEATGLCAVSVDYRLAPEHPFPAGPDDCEDAALWLLDGGTAELGAPARLAIGGESAGAHLAVLTLLRLRDRHGLGGAFGAASLAYGGFDLSQTPSGRLWGSRSLVLSRASLAWFADCFCPQLDSEQRRDPAISPLYADLRGLPPALFTIGTQDPLLDDSLFMEARWRAAGNEARLAVYEEAAHGFTFFPIAVARQANAAIHAFLAEAVER
jgi:acetyl esterase/lipase